MRVVTAAALLAVAASAEAATPGPSTERGPVLSVRAGYGVPAGDTMRAGPAVSEVAERKFPLAFLVGYRLSPRFWALLAFEAAPATPAAPLCAGGTSCSAADVHLGAQLVLRLLPGRRVDPWLGAGVGVEVLSASGHDPASPSPGRTRWSWAGIELPYVEAGADVALTDWIGLGPWASLTFARYTSDSVRVEGSDTVSGAIRGRTVHRWVAGGLQATLRL